MKIKIGRVGSVALLLFVVSLIVLPVTSFAQEVENRDFGIGGGGGGGGCSIDSCSQDYCGCSTTSVGGFYVLVGWDCTCYDNYCEKDCHYEPR